jgi:hypothetical protein
MDAKCPSCESETLSFIMNPTTSVKKFSCWDCGDVWYSNFKEDRQPRPRCYTFLRLKK